MRLWFERLIEQFKFVEDETTARRVLHELTRQAGFDQFAYAQVQDNTLSVISGYHQAWQDRYFEKGYLAVDPVMVGIRHRRQAFAWSNKLAGRTGRQTPESRARQVFFEEADGFGIRSGVSIPVAAGFGNTAVLTLASHHSDYADRWVVDPVIAASAVGHICARLDPIAMTTRPIRPVKLSTNELSCLRWATEGKSLKVIAILENTTYANVRYFLRNAKRELNAQTLTQAGKIATQLRLL